jgi:hypothetical protein
MSELSTVSLSSIAIYCPCTGSFIRAYPVEVGLPELSPVTDTTAMGDSPASIVAKIGITDASHAACSIIVVGIALVSSRISK